MSVVNQILPPGAGAQGNMAHVGARFMVRAEESGGGFSLVEHPLPPRALATPLHRHSREDEYSFVLEGRVGVQLGDEVVVAETGALISKPRGQWHTLWNAGDAPARILEIMAPGGAERIFEELPALPTDGSAPDLAAIAAITGGYGIEFDWSSVERLVRDHGLTFG